MSVLEFGGESVFDPGFWRDQGRLLPAPRGRGSAWFVRTDERQWVLRHYRRGGLSAGFLGDRYCWLGERRVRAFHEWRLTARLHALGLPVPLPIAARYTRSGPMYRCDLITQRIPEASPLSVVMSSGSLPESVWRRIGNAIARVHRAGLDHADLNAHNILLDGANEVSVIDLDRGRMRAAGAWTQRNLARLHASLVKISMTMPAGRFDENNWLELLEGYASASA